jgi:hypothetical protein
MIFQTQDNFIVFVFINTKNMCKIFNFRIDFRLYSNFINIDSLLSEIKLRKRKWIVFKDTHRPKIAIESLNYCNLELFPNIHFLLKVHIAGFYSNS